MSKKVESRLEKLEARQEQREGGSHKVALVLMKPGESEDQALRRTMLEQGVGKLPPKRFQPIFLNATDARL